MDDLAQENQGQGALTVRIRAQPPAPLRVLGSPPPLGRGWGAGEELLKATRVCWQRGDRAGGSRGEEGARPSLGALGEGGWAEGWAALRAPSLGAAAPSASHYYSISAL